MALNKSNEYVDMLPSGMLANIPKSVWGAIVISEYLNRLNIPQEDLAEAILGEWQTLYNNHIVSQKPTKCW